MTRTIPRPSASRTTALRAGASVAVLASGALLLLSACGSNSGSSSAASATSSGTSSAAPSASGSASGDAAQAMSKYRDCLTQHGVTMPSFSPGAGRHSGAPSGRPSGGAGGGRGGFGGGFGGSSADPKTAAAMQACESLRPQISGQRAGGAGGADSTAFKAFTSCLKDHGVTLPTPSPGATNGARAGGFGGTRGLNTADPKTAKAYDTCKALLPQRPSSSPS